MSRVSAAPMAKTATSVRIAVTESTMPPKVTPSFSAAQVSARSVRRAPQMSASSGTAAIATRVPTTTGISPPSCGRVRRREEGERGLLEEVVDDDARAEEPERHDAGEDQERPRRQIAHERQERPRHRDGAHQPRERLQEPQAERRGRRLPMLGGRRQAKPDLVDEARRPPQPDGAREDQREEDRRLGVRREVEAGDRPGGIAGQRHDAAEQDHQPRPAPRLARCRAAADGAPRAAARTGSPPARTPRSG